MHVYDIHIIIKYNLLRWKAIRVDYYCFAVVLCCVAMRCLAFVYLQERKTDVDDGNDDDDERF